MSKNRRFIRDNNDEDTFLVYSATSPMHKWEIINEPLWHLHTRIFAENHPPGGTQSE